MATAQPPTENLPIFNPSVFYSSDSSGLTIDQANALYVHYPYAQGTVNFPDIEVSNNALVDNDLTITGLTTSGDIISENSLIVSGDTTLGMGAVSDPANITNANLNTTYTYIASSISGLTNKYPVLNSVNGMYLAITGNSDSAGAIQLYNTAAGTGNGIAYSFRQMTGTGAWTDVFYIRKNGRVSILNYLDFTSSSTTPYILYKDNTQQNTAYTGAGALAGSYTSTNLTIDANGKITAISNGSGGGGGASLSANQTFTGLNTFSQVLTGTVGAAFGTNQSTDAAIFKCPVYSTSGSSTNPLEYGLDVSSGTYTDKSIPSRKYNDARYASLSANTFTGIQTFSSTVQGTNTTTPMLYPNTITTFTSPQSLVNKAFTDATYLPLTGSPSTGASYTFNAAQQFNSGINVSASNTSIFNGGAGIFKTCQIGANGVNDYLTIRAPIYTDLPGSVKPMSYLNDVSTYTPLTDNMIMNKKYIDNIIGTGSNLSITSLTTSAGATIGTNLQVNGNTILGDGIGTDTTSINGNIFGSTNTTPLSYPSTVVSFSSSTQNIPSIAYTNANYASIANNNTFSGTQTFTSTVQGDATGVYPLIYPASVTNYSSNHSIPDRGYNDGIYLRVAGSSSQTAAGTYTFSNPPTMSGANISSSSIPNSALANGSLYMTTTSAQTVSGAKNFTTAPTLSGANITAATIPSSALVDTFLTSGANTYTGIQSYSNTIQGTNSTSAISYTASISNAAFSTSQHIPSKGYCDYQYLIAQSGTAQAANNVMNFSANNTHSGTETFSGLINANNGISVNSNVMLSSTGNVWGKSYREKLSAATINTAGTVYTIDWSTSGTSTLNTAPTANFTLNIWNASMSSTQTTVMTLLYSNTGKFKPATVNFYSDSGTTLLTVYIAWLGGTPTIATSTFTACTFSLFPSGVIDATANNICLLTLGNYY